MAFAPMWASLSATTRGQLLWTRRYGHNSWQFPQGGSNPGESAEETMFRELYEEVGLQRRDVRILGSTRNWLKYRIPNRLIRRDSKPLCVGQKQKWFLLKLNGSTDKIDFEATDHPEFDDFLWVSYWYPVRQVVAFKRDVYREALSELMPAMMKLQSQNAGGNRKRKPQNQNRNAKQKSSKQHHSSH